MPVPALHQNPLRPVLLESDVLEVSVEQRRLVREVLLLTSADSDFAQKAADAIIFILTSGRVLVPTITSLDPGQAVITQVSFLLRVIGQRFQSGCVIYFDGFPKTTTFVNSGEVTCEILVQAHQTVKKLPVHVVNPTGAVSNPAEFNMKATLASLSVTPLGQKLLDKLNEPVPTNPIVDEPKFDHISKPVQKDTVLDEMKKDK